MDAENVPKSSKLDGSGIICLFLGRLFLDSWLNKGIEEYEINVFVPDVYLSEKRRNTPCFSYGDIRRNPLN
jgi:hypothetical protein